MLRRADRPARGRPGRSWPDSMVPTCVVHLIRASMRFVAHKGPQGGRRRPAPDLHRPRRGGRPTGPRRLPPVRPGPQVPADGGDVGEGLGEEHRLPGLPPGPAPGHLHHQRDRVAELPAAQGHQEPRPLPLRRGGGQTAVAGGSATSRTAGPRSAPRRRTRPPTRAGPRADSSRDRSPPTGSRPWPSSPPPTPTESTPISDRTRLHRNIDRLFHGPRASIAATTRAMAPHPQRAIRLLTQPPP